MNKLIIITEDNDIQPLGSIFEMEDLSVNVPKSYTFWFGNENDEFKKLIKNKKIHLKCDKKIFIDSIDENNNINLSNDVVYTDSGIQLLFEHHEQKIIEYKISIYNENIKINEITFIQKYIELLDRLYILANNLGIQINEDWNKAFIETDIYENEIDYVIHNRKISEFLMNAFNLIGLRGSYKTFNTAIDYFGYKNILWFEETWINKDNKKRLTKINNSLIDKKFTKEGFTKIGELIMFYSLDELDSKEPYDEGGLMQYEYKNLSYNDLYTKLVILRKVLQEWFLPYDVYISDIIGEFHSVSGLQKKIWINNDIFLNIDEHSRFDFMDIKWDNLIEKNKKYYTYVSEHKLIIENDLYNIIDNNLIELKQHSAHLQKSIYKIDMIDDEIIDLQDFDIITKFFVKDVAILNQKIELSSIDDIPEYINGFVLRLVKINKDKQEILYSSKLISIEEIFNISRLGITELGDFEISITAFDCYGYSKSWSKEFTIEKQNIAFDFLCLRPEYITDENNEDFIKRFLQFQTMQSTLYDGIPIYDAAVKDFDINNPNKEIGNTRIARKYYYMGNNIKSANIQMKRNILINQLNKIPISENWNPYNLCFIKLNHNHKFSISLKTFEHEQYNTIVYENDNQFLLELNEMSKKINNAFNYFDFDIQLLNTINRERLFRDENKPSNGLYNVLIIFDKQKDFSLNKVIYRIEIDDDVYTNENNSNLLIKNLNSDIFKHNKIYPSFAYDPIIKFNHVELDSDINHEFYKKYKYKNCDFHIRLKINNKEFISEKEYGSKNPGSENQFDFSNLKSILKSMLNDEQFNSLNIMYYADNFSIQSKYGYSIEMSHVSLGYKIATKRDGSIKKLFKTTAGSNFQVGSMVILMPNEDIKINTFDVKWIIRDTFTKIKYFESDNYVCKWINFRKGIYDVECYAQTENGDSISSIKRACLNIE